MPKIASRNKRVRAAKLNTQLRREQIAHAALSLLGAKGLKGLSVAAVAREVGLVPSALYRHFGSVEDVLDAVFDLIRQQLLTNVDAVCQETADCLPRLERLLQRHIALIRHNPGIPSLVFSEDASAQSPQRKAKVYATIREYLSKVAAIIAEGQRTKQVPGDIDPQAGAILFLGIIQPAAFLWHLSGGKAAIDAQTAGAWQLVRVALSARQIKTGAGDGRAL